MHVGLGTDIGGGTSFSLLATMGAAYEIAQLGGRALSAVEAFYLATLGGARALALDDRIGTIAPGHEADLAVLDPNATPLLALRNARAESVTDVLFALMMLGDDRAVRATYVAGQGSAHARDRMTRPAIAKSRRKRRSRQNSTHVECASSQDEEGGHVLPFRRAASRARRARGRTPLRSKDVEKYARDGRARRLSSAHDNNGLALAFCVVLVAVGVWLANTIAEMRQESGLRAVGPAELRAGRTCRPPART